MRNEVKDEDEDDDANADDRFILYHACIHITNRAQCNRRLTNNLYQYQYEYTTLHIPSKQ